MKFLKFCLLAIGMIALSGYGIVKYVKSDVRFTNFLSDTEVSATPIIFDLCHCDGDKCKKRTPNQNYIECGISDCDEGCAEFEKATGKCANSGGGDTVSSEIN
ncbi:hypothetical protein ACF3OB_00485 [Capnocytophaga canis]|uniref:hypothetical protein n=1 Tax=Capnocytophaga canis TaxID=1848903 RepID=UPI00370D5D1B